MGRKGKQGGGSSTDFDSERTLAAAEEEGSGRGPWDDEPTVVGGGASTLCLCGGREFLLEAYLHVVGGVVRPEPVEVQRLTCPECEREFEAIQGEGGRILRGDFLGYATDDEGDDT